MIHSFGALLPSIPFHLFFLLHAIFPSRILALVCVCGGWLVHGRCWIHRCVGQLARGLGTRWHDARLSPLPISHVPFPTGEPRHSCCSFLRWKVQCRAAPSLLSTCSSSPLLTPLASHASPQPCTVQHTSELHRWGAASSACTSTSLSPTGFGFRREAVSFRTRTRRPIDRRCGPDRKGNETGHETRHDDDVCRRRRR